MVARNPRRQPYWKSHAKGYAYVLFLCCAFSAMLIWSNRTNDDVPQHLVIDPKPITREPLPSDLPSQATKATTSTDSTTHPFSPDDVVVMLKTGATTMWHRVPMHLSTSFANKTLTPNVLIYSDTPASIGGHPVIDALANVSTTLQASPDFEPWHALQQAARDNLPLDNQDPAARRLDKYKSLPLANHAAHAFPRNAWFVSMDDDAFFFWDTLHAWLAAFDPDAPVALGGAGLVALSRGAMRASFLADSRLADTWEQYAAEHCCGDQILAHVLASRGVVLAQADVPLAGRGLARLGVGAGNWCGPLVGVRGVRPQEAAELHAWEREFMGRTGGAAVRYGDVFARFVAPFLVAERDGWDNYAEEEHYSSGGEGAGGTALSGAEKREKPWFSADACRRACVKKEECLQWRYSDDDCYHGSEVKRGHRVKYGVRMRSGWVMERIEKLSQKTCERLQWGDLRG